MYFTEPEASPYSLYRAQYSDAHKLIQKYRANSINPEERGYLFVVSLNKLNVKCIKSKWSKCALCAVCVWQNSKMVYFHYIMKFI